MPILFGLLIAGGLILLLSKTAKATVIVSDDDLEAMARALASEAGASDSEYILHALGWAMRNEAHRLGKSIAATIAPNGLFGAQSDGRYVSTSRLAETKHYIAARAVITGVVEDYTEGATNFDHPRAQRAALKRNVTGYVRTPEEVAERRRAGGMEMVTLPGVDPDYLRFWRYV